MSERVFLGSGKRLEKVDFFKYDDVVRAFIGGEGAIPDEVCEKIRYIVAKHLERRGEYKAVVDASSAYVSAVNAGMPFGLDLEIIGKVNHTLGCNLSISAFNWDELEEHPERQFMYDLAKDLQENVFYPIGWGVALVDCIGNSVKITGFDNDGEECVTKDYSTLQQWLSK